MQTLSMFLLQAVVTETCGKNSLESLFYAPPAYANISGEVNEISEDIF